MSKKEILIEQNKVRYAGIGSMVYMIKGIVEMKASKVETEQDLASIKNYNKEVSRFVREELPEVLEGVGYGKAEQVKKSLEKRLMNVM